MIENTPETAETTGAAETIETIETAGNIAQYTVTEISAAVRAQLEHDFSHIIVLGEVSKPHHAASGHVYFTLKDHNAILHAVCWKSLASRLGKKIKDGESVACTGRLTAYAGQSRYQLIIEDLRPVGRGQLLAQIEERRKKLAAEGLFDETRKKNLPILPARIGVITSPTGAVRHDIQRRLNERTPRSLVLAPVAVQGTNAEAEIIAALEQMNALPAHERPEVIILARGGGSFEDLMPFNGEALVRAIAASEIPIIAAIGHETDTTLADLAADIRAPTPTAAADDVVPLRHEQIQRLAALMHEGLERLYRRLTAQRQQIQALIRGLAGIPRLLEGARQRLDEYDQRRRSLQRNQFERRTNRLTELQLRLGRQQPQEKILRRRTHFDTLRTRLRGEMILAPRRQYLRGQARLLDGLSFPQTLARGFALVQTTDGHTITQAAATSAGQILRLHFNDGTVPVHVQGETQARKKTKKALPTKKQNTLFS
ncbi:MAG: exodeoxyribonuclease VII large subunit [Pseudomonadota bacterium]